MSTAAKAGYLHGQGTCFMPLEQMAQDFFAPRIVQVAGAYPGLTREEFFAVQSEEAAPEGQWTYDFSDPDGPQVGTVAVPGSNLVSSAIDPVAIVAEHPSLGISLPPAITEAVDLLVVADRGVNTFEERKFMVLQNPGESTLRIGAFTSKEELSPGTEIVGRVLLVQIPWLPSMKPTKSGFIEVDEYF